MSIYLDYNASAPIDPRVLDVMIDTYRNRPGNADSRTHEFGDHARTVVENARKQVAELLGIKPDEVFFTSGATESNNIAIQGLQEYAKTCGKKHIITTGIEHKAVLETCKVMQKRGFEVDFVNPDKSGCILPEQILRLVRDDTLLVSIQHVNNETGCIQPIKEIGEELSGKEVLFHTDATQSCGKLVEELRTIKYNMLSFSAHKLSGPQGIGVLVLRKNRYKLPPIKPIMFGGPQEKGISPGTVPVALVAGCGKACELASTDYKSNEVKIEMIRDEILRLLGESGIEYKINGSPEHMVPSTLNICFPGIMSEALMLSTKQFCSISNGSACNSKSYEPSYVLRAMGIPDDQIECSVRVSWGSGSELASIKQHFEALLNVVRELA